MPREEKRRIFSLSSAQHWKKVKPQMFAPRKWLCLLAPKRPPTGVESRAKLLNRCTWLKFSDFDLCSPRSGQGQPIFARCTMDPLPMLLFIVPPVLLMHQTTPRVYSSDWLVLARNWLSIGDAILPPQNSFKGPKLLKKNEKVNRKPQISFGRMVFF